jgi:CRISPR-associated RAMP protein (TIGR02581 family)
MSDYSFEDFDKFKVRYGVEGEIVNETPIRIGSGGRQEFGSVDNPVITLPIGGRERPVIPGSSWKGVMRSEAERFVNSSPEIGKERGWEFWRACDIFEVTSNPDIRREEEKNPCIVCRIFGNTGVASHVHFFDSLPKGDAPLQVIRRVAIDRITAGQSPGRLFDVQIVPPKTRWDFRMRIINIEMKPEDPRGFLLSYLFKQLLDGIQIGGGKSIGYGLMVLIPDTVKVKKMKIEGGKLKTEEYTGPEALKALGVG